MSIIKGGKLENATKIQVGFTQIKPDMITANDIIGGVKASTGKYTGLELVDQVYPKFRIVPGLLGCPKWSTKPGVAAVMKAKVENINGIFTGMSVVYIPCDSTGADVYSEAPEWKNLNNYMSERQIVCWPKIKLDDKVFHLSTQL